ncbi:unnamed protein product [Cyclocybe aegerita]|uniref:Uncharacterized protein n=1 Tax=Cyclocybe aegerita TaxID=1973307 RepID=A0A8S0X4M3_CYCAE|nr:unnamed protein product [Cyclocybe aegerita]
MSLLTCITVITPLYPSRHRPEIYNKLQSEPTVHPYTVTTTTEPPPPPPPRLQAIMTVASLVAFQETCDRLAASLDAHTVVCVDLAKVIRELSKIEIHVMPVPQAEDASKAEDSPTAEVSRCPSPVATLAETEIEEVQIAPNVPRSRAGSVGENVAESVTQGATKTATEAVTEASPMNKFGDVPFKHGGKGLNGDEYCSHVQRPGDLKQAFHYRNTDRSVYYMNPDGSTYHYAPRTGRSRYQPAPGDQNDSELRTERTVVLDCDAGHLHLTGERLPAHSIPVLNHHPLPLASPMIINLTYAFQQTADRLVASLGVHTTAVRAQTAALEAQTAASVGMTQAINELSQSLREVKVDTASKPEDVCEPEPSPCSSRGETLANIEIAELRSTFAQAMIDAPHSVERVAKKRMSPREKFGFVPFSSGGTNQRGNRYCGHIKRPGDREQAYHYLSPDGSVFYKNPDGSTYRYKARERRSYYRPPPQVNGCQKVTHDADPQKAAAALVFSPRPSVVAGNRTTSTTTITSSMMPPRSAAPSPTASASCPAPRVAVTALASVSSLSLPKLRSRLRALALASVEAPAPRDVGNRDSSKLLRVLRLHDDDLWLAILLFTLRGSVYSLQGCLFELHLDILDVDSDPWART